MDGQVGRAILGQTVMWVAYLSSEADLLKPEYPLLTFDGPVKAELEVGLDDYAWLKCDDVAGSAQQSDEMPGLFD